MEKAKSPCNSLLAFAVFVNIILTLTSVGFVVYKVRVLEEQVYQLQTKSSVATQTEINGNGDDELPHRRKRSSDSLGEAKRCVSCHNACVTLFGLGASAKVRRICK